MYTSVVKSVRIMYFPPSHITHLIPLNSQQLCKKELTLKYNKTQMCVNTSPNRKEKTFKCQTIFSGLYVSYVSKALT